MALSLTNFDNVLKEFYEGAIRDTVNNDVPFFKLLEQSDKEWSGRRVVFPVHSTRNSGVGARSDGGTLPTAGNQGHLLSTVSATYQYGRIQVTGPTIRAGKHAFMEAMAVEMEGITNDLRVDLGRQTWGDGTGRLAQTLTSASTTAITVLNRFTRPGQPGARYISAGQLIDIGTVASPQLDSTGVTVARVGIAESSASVTDSVEFTTAVDYTATGAFLFNHDAGGIEMMGVRGLIDVYSEGNIWGSNAYAGSAVQGIDRSTNTQWNSLVLANAGTARTINSNLMQIAFDRIHTESGLDPDLIIGHHSVVRAFLDSVTDDRRYGTPSFDAGMSSLSYNGVMLERDRLAPFNELLVLNRSALKLFTLLPLEFADDDGAILSRVSNQDAYEAYLRFYGNMGVDGHIKSALMIRDINVDVSGA